MGASCKGNNIATSLYKWLESLPEHLLAASEVGADELYKSFPKAYTIYEPMLLLSPKAFKSPSWLRLIPHLSQEHLQTLYKYVLSRFRLTHLAMNAPIPLQHVDINGSDSEYNILRLPSSIQPLYGDFGPQPASITSAPTAEDLDSAFWVSVRQNGIVQIWAPLHTMFSRGNITEKSRILSLPSVVAAVQQGRGTGRKCAVVDLYAGIGYFAFSYVKAGVDVCLCWEISGWSVEGLRRGARANKWRTQIVTPEKEITEIADDVTLEGYEGDGISLLVFQESNEYAPERIRKLRDKIPPVRHVNSGYLPSSKHSWKSALDVLDPVEGGWLHLHQNIAVKDIEETVQDILTEVKELVDDTRVHEVGSGREHALRVPELQNVAQVKTYAPGVMHCVLDIFVPPTPEPSRLSTMEEKRVNSRIQLESGRGIS